MTPPAPVGGESAIRVAVVGAGVLGLFTALRLARAGARVTVYEAALAGPNASAVAAGMIAPAAEAWLEPPLRSIVPDLLHARTVWTAAARDLQVPLAETGTRFSGPSARLRDQGALLESLGLAATWEKNDGNAPTLFAAQDAHLAAAPALAALRRALGEAGGEVVAGRVEAQGQGFTVDGRPLAADLVVIATGWTPAADRVAPELAGLRPIKGQLLRFDHVLPQGPVLRGPDVYVAPHPNETVVGATMEPGLYDLAPDPAQIAALHRAALALAPELEGAPYRAQVGVRAETADGLPLVGPSIAPGVLLAVGARRNGWLLAPLVAEIIVAQALGRPLAALAPLADRLHPGRFTTREDT